LQLVADFAGMLRNQELGLGHLKAVDKQKQIKGLHQQQFMLNIIRVFLKKMLN